MSDSEVTLPPDARLDLRVDRIHQIVVPGLLFAKLRVIDWEHQPLGSRPCALQVASLRLDETADNEARVVFALGRATLVGDGLLTVESPTHGYQVPRAVELVNLAPIEEPVGQRQRLDNLGYLGIEPPPEPELPSVWAIEEFQCDHELTVDGVCGPETQARLAEAHGH